MTTFPCSRYWFSGYVYCHREKWGLWLRSAKYITWSAFPSHLYLYSIWFDSDTNYSHCTWFECRLKTGVFACEGDLINSLTSFFVTVIFIFVIWGIRRIIEVGTEGFICPCSGRQFVPHRFFSVVACYLKRQASVHDGVVASSWRPDLVWSDKEKRS